MSSQKKTRNTAPKDTLSGSVRKHLARPIHTHNKDNHFGRVSSVSVLSRDHWSPVLLLMYGSPLVRPAHVWCPSHTLVTLREHVLSCF